MTALVIPLSQLDRSSLPVAGGKGANLGELTAAGAPVPPGFVITTDAYRATMRDGRIAERLITAREPGELAALREQIAAVHLTEPLHSAIVTEYRRLGGGPVAVRSSGTAEDLPGAAFAGQHDSYLNVVGEAEVVAAVRKCWSSLWTDRVVEYRRELAMDISDLAIAVVIQRMVDSQSAGVMFTANPVSGARDQAVIDASPGLGEAVVSGLATPDHYIVDKRRGRVLESTLGRREVVIRSIPGGGTRETTHESDTTPALDRATIRRLVAIGSRIEAHFGQPQDIEWCTRGNDLYIVQARPITAIPDPLEPVSAPQRLGLSLLAELVPRRPYPLDVSAWMVPGIGGVQAFTAAMGVGFPSVDSLFTQDHRVVKRARPPRVRLGPKTPFTLIRSALRGDRYTKEALASDPRMIRFLADVDAGLNRDLSVLTMPELAVQLDQANTLFPLIMRLRTRFLPRAALATARFMLSLTLLGQRKNAALLIGGVDTLTAETNRELERLATEIRDDPGLVRIFADNPPDRIAAALAESPSGRNFEASLVQFLHRYGHRESVMLFISAPTWRDAPEIVLGLLKGMAAAPAQSTKESPSVRAEADLFATPLLRRGPLAALLRRQLAAARGFTQFREDTHFYATMAHPVVRRILMEYADRLVSVGVLDDRDEVFYLHRDELTALDDCPPAAGQAAALRELVTNRKTIMDDLASTPMIDRRYLAGAKQPTGALLQGTGGSRGTATGPVRIVNDPSEFSRLRAGEVLVAPFTNPSWTPLFQRACAAIIDTGAAMSHAAIVAREYGIPAVLGTVEATRRLRDGQLVTVDGDRGLVFEASQPTE